MAQKKMTQNLFIAIKVLLEAGTPHTEIAEHLGVSKGTVGRVKAAETLENYLQGMRAMQAVYAAKKKQKKAEQPEPQPEPQKAPEPQIVEHRQSVTMQMTHYAETELRKQTEVLELISRKLTEQIDLLNKLLDCWKES